MKVWNVEELREVVAVCDTEETAIAWAKAQRPDITEWQYEGGTLKGLEPRDPDDEARGIPHGSVHWHFQEYVIDDMAVITMGEVKQE